MLIKIFQYKWFLLITLELQALLRREIEILNHLNQLVWINLSKFSSMIKLISLGLGKKEKRQFDFIYLGSTLVSGQNWVRMDLGRLLLKLKKKKRKKRHRAPYCWDTSSATWQIFPQWRKHGHNCFFSFSFNNDHQYQIKQHEIIQ